MADHPTLSRELYESEQRFRLLVQAVRDYAIYMLDVDGRVTNWNTGAEAIKGYKEQEIVGQHFSRFYTEEDRARGEPTRALAVHGFAAQTGGRAEIESVEGQGTTIRLVLPRTSKAMSSAPAGSLAMQIPQGIKVLLVEDNDQVREFADHLLGEMKCQVVNTVDGKDALAALELEKFDLLFSDVVMPEMSGLDLARIVRERYPDLPVLLATGYSEEISEDAASEFEVVRKPYGAEALGAKIAAAIGRKAAAR